MSGKIQGALYGRELKRTQMLVALAMADHADHDGHNVRPAQKTIAWKIGISVRQVQRIQGELRDLGVLEVVKYAGRSSPTEYDIIPEAVPLRPRKVAISEPKGRHPDVVQTDRSPTLKVATTDRKGRHSEQKVAISEPKGRHPDVVQTVLIEPSTTTVLETRAQTHPTLKESHNQMKHAIVEAMGWREDEIADSMWGQIDAASKALRKMGVDPWGSDVTRRARIYQINQPGKLSPSALVKWWADCGEPRVKPSSREIRNARRRQQMLETFQRLNESENDDANPPRLVAIERGVP